MIVKIMTYSVVEGKHSFDVLLGKLRRALENEILCQEKDTSLKHSGSSQEGPHMAYHKKRKGQKKARKLYLQMDPDCPFSTSYDVCGVKSSWEILQRNSLKLNLYETTQSLLSNPFGSLFRLKKFNLKRQQTRSKAN